LQYYEVNDLPKEVRRLLVIKENVIYAWGEKVPGTFSFDSWFIITNFRIVEYYDDSSYKQPGSETKTLQNYRISEIDDVEMRNEGILGSKRLTLISKNKIPHSLYYYPFNELGKIEEIIQKLILVRK
jgi:hypothetical protein